MYHNLNEIELTQMSKLLNIDLDKLTAQLDLEDEILIAAVSENSVKIRTKKGQQFFLDLK